MKERPILFSGPMVIAIREDRKGQTRRLNGLDEINLNPDAWKLAWAVNDGVAVFEDAKQAWSGSTPMREVKCPYGKPGDRLWVKETHWRLGKWAKGGVSKSGRQRWRFRATSGEYVRFVPPEQKPAREEQGWHKRPSLFMPRWASRITLDETGLRCERLQDISEADAVAEGVERFRHGWRDYLRPGEVQATAVDSYCTLWIKINGEESWDRNDWVWVVEFRRVS